MVIIKKKDLMETMTMTMMVRMLKRMVSVCLLMISSLQAEKPTEEFQSPGV